MYLAVFPNRKRADIDYAAYEAGSERMLKLAQAQPGHLSCKSCTADDGEVIAMSEWTDEASARASRNLAEHPQLQRRGRATYYDSHTAFACDDRRIHHFPSKDRP